MRNILSFALFLCLLILNNACSRKDSTYNMDVIGYIQPKNSSEITDSYWGIQASTLDKDLLLKMTSLGVKWTRLEASWPEIEEKRGEYNWAETDLAFNTTLENSITPFVTLGGGNSLYCPLTTYDDPKLAEIYGYKPAPPVISDTALNAWINFVEAAILRYRDKITYWEIWNEPNHRNYWGMTPDGKAYGYLVRETAKVILKRQPDAVIIAGAMAGIDPVFMDEFLSEGTYKMVDVITYHNYGNIPEIRIYPAFDAWKIINKYNPGIKFWQGECGYPSHSSTRDYRGTAPWGLNIQAKWLLRQAFTDVYFCKAELSNYFKLVHTSGYGERPNRENLSPLDSILGYPERGGHRIKTVGVNEKCLLSCPDFTPKPAFYAYQNLCAVMDNSFKAIDNKFLLEIKDQGVFYGIGPDDDGFPSQTLVARFYSEEKGSLLAYWLPWQPQENIMKAARIDLSVENTDFSEPVLIDPLSGAIMIIEGFSGGTRATFSDIPLMDYPLIIAEKSLVQ